jgi:hypothetical protein
VIEENKKKKKKREAEKKKKEEESEKKERLRKKRIKAERQHTINENNIDHLLELEESDKEEEEKRKKVEEEKKKIEQEENMSPELKEIYNFENSRLQFRRWGAFVLLWLMILIYCIYFY